jgi:hypothetical protein
MGPGRGNGKQDREEKANGKGITKPAATVGHRNSILWKVLGDDVQCVVQSS